MILVDLTGQTHQFKRKGTQKIHQNNGDFLELRFLSTSSENDGSRYPSFVLVIPFELVL
jgi:hypothetical protein